MAQQADNIGGNQLPAFNPMALAAEAAEAERQEHIEQAAQKAQQQHQQKRQPRKKKEGEDQDDIGLSLKMKENRAPVTLSFDPDMNKRLTYASSKLGISRSAILEQLFNRWWDDKGDTVIARQSKTDSML